MSNETTNKDNPEESDVSNHETNQSEGLIMNCSQTQDNPEELAVSVDHYNTNSQTSKGTLDEQLANVEPIYPKSHKAFTSFSKKTLRAQARMKLGWLTCSKNVLTPFIISGLKDLGVEPNVFLVAALDVLYETVSDNYRKSDSHDLRDSYVSDIPAGILTSQLTGHSYEKCISNSQLKQFHGAMVEEVFLGTIAKIEIETERYGKIPLVRVSGYSADAGRCRQFNILGLLDMVATQIHKGCAIKAVGLIEGQPEDYSLPSALAESIRKNVDRFDPNLVVSIEFWRNSVFCLANTRWIPVWLHEQAVFGTPAWSYSEKGRTIYLAKLSSYICALKSMNWSTEQAQFVGTIKPSSSGRLCPEGGSVVNLVSNLGMLLIQPLPCDRPRVKITIDLKCAQLIELAVVLGSYEEFGPEIIQGCAESLEKLKAITQSGKSVWPHIAPDGFDLENGGKAALKQVAYGAAYGLKRQHMLHTVNQSLEKKGIEFRFHSAKELDPILEGPILGPIMAAREAFFEKYSLDNVKKTLRSKGKRVVLNAVGRPFNLVDQLKRFEDEGGKDPHKIAGRLLAHLGQGKEQQVMQDFVANCLRKIPEDRNVELLVWKYDGMSLAVPQDDVEWIKEHCQGWLQQNYPNHVFDCDTHWFLANPVFWAVAKKVGLLNMLNEGHYTRYNRDMRGWIDPFATQRVNWEAGWIIEQQWDGQTWREVYSPIPERFFYRKAA